MRTLIDTVGDVLFQQKEILKVHKEKREELVNSLSRVQHDIHRTQDYIANLEAEHKQVCDTFYGAKLNATEGCNLTENSISNKNIRRDKISCFAESDRVVSNEEKINGR